MLRGILNSIGTATTGAGGTGTLYIDKTDDNYGIGESLTFHADAEDNIALGENALNSTSGAALKNIAIGTDSLTALTTGDSNIAIGYNALIGHTTGDKNIAIGPSAMDGTGGATVLGSTENIFIGYDAGGGTWTTAVSNYNVGVGNNVMDAAMNGALNNTALGHGALGALSTGDSNIAVGSGAGDGITTWHYNIAVGVGTLNADCGSGNTAIGHKALTANTGTYNTALGYQALYTSTAVDNCVALGYQALYFANDDAADGVVAIGYGAGFSYVPTGDPTTAGTTLIGYNAGNDGNDDGHGLTTGKQNTAVGHQTLGANANAALTGNGNAVMGYRAGYGLTGVASYNTLVGRVAGDGITSGSGNTCIGNSSDAGANSYSNAIGYAAETQNNYETRIGYYGGFQFYSGLVICDLGGVAEDDPAHAIPIGKIPQHSVLLKATVVVTTLSSDANHSLKLVLSTSSTGTDNTALGNVQEIIGAGAIHSWSSGGAAGGAADINVASGATIKTAYAAIPYDPASATDAGLPTLDTTTGDHYLYLAFANTSHTGGDANPSTAPEVRVMVEFVGQD